MVTDNSKNEEMCFLENQNTMKIKVNNENGCLFEVCPKFDNIVFKTIVRVILTVTIFATNTINTTTKQIDVFHTVL